MYNNNQSHTSINSATSTLKHTMDESINKERKANENEQGTVHTGN